MTPNEKAKELVDKMYFKIQPDELGKDHESAKQCAVIAVENEYSSLREQLFNLRACRVIESEKVYLFRVNKLIEQEKQVKEEIKKL